MATYDTHAITAKLLMPRDELVSMNLTLTGVAQQLASNKVKIFTIQAEPTNTGYVYVGSANTVSSSVHMATLSAGSSYTFTVNDTNLIYVIGTAGDKICGGGEDYV